MYVDGVCVLQHLCCWKLQKRPAEMQVGVKRVYACTVGICMFIRDYSWIIQPGCIRNCECEPPRWPISHNCHVPFWLSQHLVLGFVGVLAYQPHVSS
jgi:hypothetical protein